MTEPFKTAEEFDADYNQVQQSVELACAEIDCLITRLPRGCVSIHGFAANSYDLRAAAQRMALCVSTARQRIVNANAPRVCPEQIEGSHDFALAVSGKPPKK